MFISTYVNWIFFVLFLFWSNVRDHQVLVEEPNTDASIHGPDFSHRTYIAGKVNVKDVESGSMPFTVGDGSGGYENPALEKGVKYLIFLGSCSSTNDTVRIGALTILVSSRSACFKVLYLN